MRTTRITIINKTGSNFELLDCVLDKGEWRKPAPPKRIGAGSIVILLAENKNKLQGISGTVKYQIKGTPDVLTLSWKNPVIGRNRYSISAGEKHKVEQTGGIGYNAMVAFTINDI